MFKFQIIEINTKDSLTLIGRQFRDEAFLIHGLETLSDQWWEQPIEDIAAAYKMLIGYNGALLKRLSNWRQKKYANFNPGWCCCDTAFILKITYKPNVYLNRFRFMRAAIELMKLGNTGEPSCPILPQHKLQFPTDAPGQKKKNAISFDHCVPQSSGLGATNCPICFCSLEANQMKGHTPWHIWLAFRDSIKDYARQVQSAKARLESKKMKPNGTTSAPTDKTACPTEHATL